MTLPFNPHTDVAVVIGVQTENKEKSESIRAKCSNCGAIIWLSPLAHEFSQKHELPVMCELCGEHFIDKEIN